MMLYAYHPKFLIFTIEFSLIEAMLERIKSNLIFGTGVTLFIISFFLPTLRLSLGVSLLGWEVFLLHLGEILVIENIVEYAYYIFTALTNFWVLGLIIGYFSAKRKWAFYALSSLAIASSVLWLIAFEYNSVLLTGYYVWETGIILIVIGRFLDFPERDEPL